MQIQRTTPNSIANAAKRQAPVDPSPKQESEPAGIVDEYIADVRDNFRKNGPINVIMGVGIQGMLGGMMGGFAGNMISGFFPGPVGVAIGEFSGAVGATLGAGHGLARPLF